MISAMGETTFIAPLDEPVEEPSLTIDYNSKVAYVGSDEHVVQIDLTKGATVKTISLGGGGRIRHVAWDSGLKKLFGLWQSNQNVVSLVELTSGVMKSLVSISPAGSVHRAYYGIEPHHYALFFRPDNHTLPLQLIFLDTTTYEVHLQNDVQAGVVPHSFAIDYVNNNCWIVWRNSSTATFNFGIMHMNGQLQEVVYATKSYAQAGPAAVIDISNQFYYTTLYAGSTAFYAQLALSTGLLDVNPIMWDIPALGWTE